MERKIRWGIAGLGNIAHKFASDLKLIPNAQLMAVGSRSMQKAVEFDPQHSAAWKLLGKALAADNQNEQAIAAYQQGIEVAETKG